MGLRQPNTISHPKERRQGFCVALDITTLTALRRQHPAWKLFLSDHAPLVASFLHRVFVAPNVRYMSAANLSAALEDELFALREQQAEAAYPRCARD